VPPTRPSSRSAARLAAEVQTYVGEQGLRPSLLVRCERQAFVGRGEWADLRVTFDENIGWRADDLTLRPRDRRMAGLVLGTDPCVLEIKVDAAVPRWLADAVAELALVPRSHSKYSAGLDAAGLVRPPAPAGPARRAVPGERPRLPRVALETVWTR
jgi:hypothetical protein